MKAIHDALIMRLNGENLEELIDQVAAETPFALTVNGQLLVTLVCTPTELDAVEWAIEGVSKGAGEILLNCIDRDGTNQGFDIELINAVKSAVSIPVIASSGAGCAEHFEDVFKKTDAESALAAGIFHRREVPIGDVKQFLKGKVEIRG